jgi:CHAT domain-containing protein
MKPATGDLHRQIVDRNFMLFDHSISYCFSANLLREMQQSESPADLKSELAAFAPHFPEHLFAGSNLPPSFVQTVHDLKPLGNQREVDEIAEKVDVRPYANSEATKENFWEACKNYAFVHVASHGILNQDPNLNFVAFSQNSDTLDQTELLFLRELYAQRLHQELIVFSACETSLGQFREGEGNLSMARGLAYSGVRSFITTLWKVSPDANRQIMPGFYQLFLDEKKPKDIALAEARRAFILASVDNEQLDKWAGLVLIGSTERARQSGWAKWAFTAVLAGGLILYWANRRRRNSSKGEKP